MWNSRTVGIYIEDGNEMNNTISNNVAICARQDRCSPRGDSGLSWQDNGFGGIYGYGMTNNFIGHMLPKPVLECIPSRRGYTFFT